MAEIIYWLIVIGLFFVIGTIIIICSFSWRFIQWVGGRFGYFQKTPPPTKILLLPSRDRTFSVFTQDGMELLLQIKMNLEYDPKLAHLGSYESIIARIGAELINYVGHMQSHREIFQDPRGVLVYLRNQQLDSASAWTIKRLSFSRVETGRNLKLLMEQNPGVPAEQLLENAG